MLLIRGELSISNISLRCELKAVEKIYFIKKKMVCELPGLPR